MTIRDAKLRRFIETAAIAFQDNPPSGDATRSLAQIFEKLETPLLPMACAPAHRPACKHLQEVARNLPNASPQLKDLIDALNQLAPMLKWHHRDGDSSSGSSNFSLGHANAFIVGPGGLEERSDVMLGVSLLAPEVTYPVHQHRPEEIYLFATSGEFLHGERGWIPIFSGGSLYNPPWITHAMRSKADAFLAFWALNDIEAQTH